MENNTSNASLSEQLKLAKLLLQEHDTFHPFMEMQMQGYLIACCNISLGGEIKMDASSKIITYDIKTEKGYKRTPKGFRPNPKNKISAKKYKAEVAIAKLNLETWTRILLWGDATTVKVYIDGKEI